VPVARGLLESIRASLGELHEELQRNGVKDPLPEVDEDTLMRVRRMVHLSNAV
jgi:ubiquitin C-terminal hydrolase